MLKPKTIQAFVDLLAEEEKAICLLLIEIINNELAEAEAKIWHAHPVWFLDGNPIVGFSMLKAGIRVMFWSGVSFEEPQLVAGTGKFKDASITYASIDQIKEIDLRRWLTKARAIQWDYKNVMRNRALVRLK